MRIRKMISDLFQKAGDWVYPERAEARKRIRPIEINSADLQDCPHELSPELQALVDGVQNTKRLVLEEEILSSSPTVRMMFQTNGEQAPMVRGHMIRSKVIQNEDSDDMLEVTIRVNALQAASLPFVGVYDEQHD